MQHHDYNGGIAPSGLFWTVPIPDDALTVHGNTATLHLEDFAVVDSRTFLNPVELPATVNLDVTWVASGTATRFRPGSADPTDPTNFSGQFQAAVATGSFSGSTPALAFSFHGENATSEGVFAEMGREKNGAFLKGPEAAGALARSASPAALEQAARTGGVWPNPARESTDLEFSLPAWGPAAVRVFDLAGREVTRLMDESLLGAGSHTARWDLSDGAGRRVAAGVYLVQLKTRLGTTTHRVTVLP